jgi:hypothetical protein
MAHVRLNAREHAARRDMANTFLPGLDEEALAAGAVKASAMSEAAGVVAGQRLPVFKDCTSDLPCIQARTLLLCRHAAQTAHTVMPFRQQQEFSNA